MVYIWLNFTTLGCVLYYRPLKIHLILPNAKSAKSITENYLFYYFIIYLYYFVLIIMYTIILIFMLIYCILLLKLNSNKYLTSFLTIE